MIVMLISSIPRT